MNILHITTFLQGGAGRVICDLACAQHACGHAVTVVTTERGAPGYGNYSEWLRVLRASGVDVRFVHSTFTREFALNLHAAETVRALSAGLAIDIVHAHAAIPSLVGLIVASGCQHPVPVLQTMHGWGVAKTAVQAAMDVAIMNEVDRVVPVSHAARRFLEGAGVDPSLLTVIACGIEALPPTAPPEAIPPLADWKRDGRTVFCCLGSLGARKNQRLLIESLADARTSRAACIFVGEGDVEGAKELAARRGVADRVWFTGYQDRGWRFLAWADWLVLPSLGEGLPVSVLEAFRAGVPVLGSDIAEIAELVTPDATGLLFASGSRKACCEALQRAIEMPADRARQLGEAGRSLWASHYTFRHMLEGYSELYERLLADMRG